MMNILNRNLNSALLILLVICGATACASKEKAVVSPEADRAPEAKQGQGTAENQQASQELKRQHDEEAARQKRIDLERLKEEEAARAAAVSQLAPEQLEKVYFDFDKHEVKQDFRAPLERNAAIIKDHSNVKVVVEGHCDERGSEEYNLALGERRSMAVKTFLVSLGVKEGQLYTISYGEERPADKGHDEKAWARNRRVQFARE